MQALVNKEKKRRNVHNQGWHDNKFLKVLQNQKADEET